MCYTRLYDARNDSALIDQIRNRFATEFPEIKVENLSYWGKGVWNNQYFIQLKCDLYPAGAHYEYLTDTANRFGYFEFHLEPNPDTFQVLKKIGIRLAHRLQDSPMEYGSRNKLPFGTFRTKNREEGVRDIDEFVEKFREIHGYIHPILCELCEEVVEVSLQSDSPRTTAGLIEPNVGDEEVTSEIKNLKDVMNLNLTLPDYQRDYCWDERNITDLWGNLLKVEAGKAFHLGTLIFHANKDRDSGKWKYDIIDGQQRLVTLSLILLGLGYSGNIPLLNAEYSSPDAIKNIGNAKYVVKSLIERVGNVADLLPRLLENVSFAVLVVNDSNLDLAYTFFSNQNSKGVPLSDFDLLKAHHLRFMPEGEDSRAESMAKKWNAASQMPPSYKETNSLQRVLGCHLYRLRQWMRKHDSREGTYRYIQREFQAAPTMNDLLPNYIPPRGEKFRFHEKIQGGAYFFDYVETFIFSYERFCELKPVKLLRAHLSDGRYSQFADTMETLMFGYYLKFGNQYLPEAFFCISRLMALYRYNTHAVARDGVGVRDFANKSEVVLMVDQATSPTFFLAEMMEKFDELTAGDYPIRTGLDLDEAHGVRWRIYESLCRIFHELRDDVTESIIRNKIVEEYGR